MRFVLFVGLTASLVGCKLTQGDNGSALRDVESGAAEAPAVPFDLSLKENHLPADPAYQTLADTGYYAEDGTSLNPALRSFSPQYPLWSDGLKKKRWILLPAGEKIDTSIKGTMDAWVFPVGTKFFKEFSALKPDGSQHKVETRMIEKMGDGRWGYVTFLWNDSQDVATRAQNDKTIRNVYPLSETVKHDVPSFSNCVFCHTNNQDPVLGFTALQLSDDRDPNAPHSDSASATTISTLVKENLLTEAPRQMPTVRAATALERTALGYLNGNCGSCHSFKARAGQYSMDFRYRLLKDEAGEAQDSAKRLHDAANDTISQEYKLPGTVWPAVNYAVVEGHPELSSLIDRIKQRGSRFNMPKVGSKIPDREAIELLEKWIALMPEDAMKMERMKNGKTEHPNNPDH